MTTLKSLSVRNARCVKSFAIGCNLLTHVALIGHWSLGTLVEKKLIRAALLVITS